MKNKSKAFDRAVKVVLDAEGGFVNNPKDPGGATNFGVTQKVYLAWKGDINADIRNITLDEVYDIYHDQYWQVIRGDSLPKRLGICLFDFAIHSGNIRAIKTLQEILGVHCDGFMGLLTLNAIKNMDEDYIISCLLESRLEFMMSLSSWKTFGKGWANRVGNLRTSLLGDPLDTQHAKAIEVSGNDTKALAADTSLLKNKTFVIGSGAGIIEAINLVVNHMGIKGLESVSLCGVAGALTVVLISVFLYLHIKKMRTE